MTIEAYRGLDDQTVLGSGTGVNLMTRQAGSVGAEDGDVADTSQDVAIARVQAHIIRLGKVGLKILKEIVPRDKVVRIRQAGGAGLAHPDMALRADRNHGLPLGSALFRQPDQRRVIGMLQADVAVARVAVQSKRRKGSGFKIYCRGVAAGASVRELVFVPGRALEFNPLLHTLVRG